MKTHLNFTQMEYTKDGTYKESDKHVLIPVDSLAKAIIREEGEWWRIIFQDSEGKTSHVEVVKESPLNPLPLTSHPDES